MPLVTKRKRLVRPSDVQLAQSKKKPKANLKAAEEFFKKSADKTVSPSSLPSPLRTKAVAKKSVKSPVPSQFDIRPIEVLDDENEETARANEQLQIFKRLSMQ